MLTELNNYERDRTFCFTIVFVVLGVILIGTLMHFANK